MTNGVLVLCAVVTSVATGWWLRNWRAAIVYAREVERFARSYDDAGRSEQLRATRRIVAVHERRAALIVMMFSAVSAFNWYAVLSAVRR